MTESCSVDSMYTSKHADNKRESIILQSIIHTSKIPGNNMWYNVVEAFNFWFKVPNDKLEKIKAITRLVQITNNTIVDASENTLLRSGKATANSVYSIADALNGAYYCCFIILERLRDFENFEAIQIGNEYFLESSKGYGMETYYRDNLICPTENEYLRVAILKTGSVLRLTIKLMQLFSANKSNVNKLTDILAKLFHIYDDFVNLYTVEEYLLNENGLDSLSKGKFIFPIVHGILSQSDDTQLMNILRQKSKDPEVLKYCLTLMEKFGCLEYTRQTLKQLKEDAEDEMMKLEENPCMKQILAIISCKVKLNSAGNIISEKLTM